jgi:transcriptional antiterminator NusG
MINIDKSNLGVRWYVAHTYSGYENKVKANLEKIIENRGLEDMIFDVRIPVEITIEKKGDKEVEVENKIFPSYVLVKMIMTEETWHVVRNITGVTGFVGPGSNPTPLSQAEVDGLELEEKKVKLPFEIGDEVVVTSGLFEGYSGTVQSISENYSKVTVLVKKGRRDLPVELDAGSVKIQK